MDRVTIEMNGQHHRRCLQLKRRVRKLDDLFEAYCQGEYRPNYAQRIIDLKHKIRTKISIMLEVSIYE